MKKLIALACLLLCRQAFAALAVDGTPITLYSSSGGTSVAVGSLTTSSTNDLIICGAISNTSSIASVTSAHLTFTSRASVQGTGGTFVAEFEAVASSALSSEAITVNFTGTSTFASAACWGISGANTSTKWDSNASIPATNNANAFVAISTSNPNDFIYSISVNDSSSSGTPGTGWTGVATSGFLLVQYQIVSTTQSNLTPTGTLPDGVVEDAVIQSASSCTHAGWTKGGAFTVPTAGSTLVWLKTGSFGTVDCSTTNYWQQSGAFGVN